MDISANGKMDNLQFTVSSNLDKVISELFKSLFGEKISDYKTRLNLNSIMKKDIHPKEYRMVVFKDMSNEYSFITKSTIITKDSVVWEDGNEYPLVKLEISNTSHPYYTGKMKLVDTAGRIDKFKSRYQKHIDGNK